MEQQVKWPEEVSIEFQLERREYVRAVRFYLRKSHLVSWIQAAVILLALVAVVILSEIMGRLTFLNTLVLVLSLMAMIWEGWLYLFQPGRLFNRDESLRERVRFLFTQEDIARQDSHAAAILDWDIHKLWRSGEFYYLFDGKGSYTILPLRAFPDSEACERFERLAVERCPGVKIKRFR